MWWALRRTGAVVVAAVVAVLIASRFDTYPLFLIGQTAILVMVAAALVLLIGVGGLISLASAATMGLGSYAAIILSTNAGLPFILAVPVAALIGGLASASLAVVAMRLSGFQLAIVTLGALQVFIAVIKGGGSLVGGGYGVFAPTSDLPLVGDLDQRSLALVCVGIATVAVLVIKILIGSHTGRVWTAMKDNEAAAKMQGINVGRERVLVFAAASGVIALAGALYGFLLGAVTPPSYSVGVSIEHIALAVVAGMSRRISGAVIAPALLFLIPSYFSGLNEYHDVLYAGLMLLALMLLPGGLSQAGEVMRSALVRTVRSARHG